MDKNIAIKVENISKKFRIPHEKITSVRGAFVNLFKKNSYEEFEALNNVSFEVKKGEFFGIIGRNGSGKSTLLKVLAGIYEADEGKVKIDGRISPFLELGIGFNPELSGRDNIYLNATILGLTRNQITKKFDEIVAFSELERFIDQKIKNYSSGMSVRLAFSVAIHARRDILLMDEVLAVGDMNFQNKCLEEFNKYKEMGKTVILVSHSIETVQKYCDRALLLRNGNISKIGKADEVGNAYIFDNISDEEKRIDLESGDRNKKDSNISSKSIKITKIQLMSGEEVPKNAFKANDDITVAISYRINNFIKDLSFRVSLETADGTYLFGADTFSCKYELNGEIGEKRILFKIKENNFLKGNYFVNASCFKKDGKVPLDFKPRGVCFEILPLINDFGCKGVMRMDYSWKQTK